MGPDKCQYSPIVCTAWAVSVPLHADTAAPEAGPRSLPSLVCTVRHLAPLELVATGHWGDYIAWNNKCEGVNSQS